MDKLRFDRAIMCLDTTISYNALYYMYDTPRFGRVIVRLHNTIEYNMLYYMYDKLLN